MFPEGQEGRPSKAMTLGQAVALLETVESGTYRLAAYVVLSLLSGVRTEEARAITWDEVDLKAGTVAVFRSAVKGDTKTRKSRRVLKLPTKAVQALRQHHARQDAERLAAGELWQEHGLVFSARTAHGWTAGKYGRSSRNHHGRPARRGMDAPRTAALSCPCSALMMSAWRTSATWLATAARRSPRPSTVTRSGPRSPRAPRP